MTDIVYDYLTMGVDMIVSAVILTAIVVLLQTVTILNNYSSQQQATVDRITYYKQFNMYDNTENLSSADAISALIYYKGELDIRIKFNCSDPAGSYQTVLYYDRNDEMYKLENNGGSVLKSSAKESDMKTWIKSTAKFDAVLYEDMQPTHSTHYTGGIVSGITFTTDDASS